MIVANVLQKLGHHGESAKAVSSDPGVTLSVTFIDA